MNLIPNPKAQALSPAIWPKAYRYSSELIFHSMPCLDVPAAFAGIFLGISLTCFIFPIRSYKMMLVAPLIYHSSNSDLQTLP